MLEPRKNASSKHHSRGTPGFKIFLLIEKSTEDFVLKKNRKTDMSFEAITEAIHENMY